jgi:hypothetical protein
MCESMKLVYVFVRRCVGVHLCESLERVLCCLDVVFLVRCECVNQ